MRKRGERERELSPEQADVLSAGVKVTLYARCSAMYTSGDRGCTIGIEGDSQGTFGIDSGWKSLRQI